MTNIKLTSWEMMQAAIAGVMRQVESHKLGRTPAHGIPGNQHWQRHIEGALGEAAVAKCLNVYWTGKGSLRDLDVGDFDVRTADAHNKRLILHEDDPDDRVFWFVTGVNDEFKVHGWIRGCDGKKPEYWQDPNTGRPAYFVPKEALHENE